MKLFLMMFVFAFNIAFAQDNNESKKQDQGQSKPDVDEKTVSKWKNDLQFGVPSSVIKSINQMVKEKYADLEPVVYPLLDNFNLDIVSAAISFYKSFEDPKIVDKVYIILSDLKKRNDKLENECLYYLQKIKSLNDEGFQSLKEMYSGASYATKIQIVRLIGEAKYEKGVEFLKDRFENLNISDNTTKSEILLALGKIGDSQSYDTLEKIITNNSEDKKVIYSAIKAISFYKDDKSFNLLKEKLNSDDAILRKTIYSSLENYPPEGTKPLLLSCLRDSYYQSRIACSNTLAKQQAKNSIPYFVYMIKNDPNEYVRKNSIYALTKLDGANSVSPLLKDKNVNSDDKRIILSTLLQDYFDSSISTITSLVQNEDDPANSFLIYLIANRSSYIKNPGIYSLYQEILNSNNTRAIIETCNGLIRNNFKQALPILEALKSKNLGITIGIKLQRAVKHLQKVK